MLSKQATVAGDVTKTEWPCVHCGLPTLCEIPVADPSDPSSAEDVDRQLVFCCGGCRQAYELIHGWGLDDYYAIRDASSAGGGWFSGGDASRYQAFDDDEYLGASKPQPLSDGRLMAELSVGGLHCAACAWLIENVASRTAGWTMARVKLNRHTVQLVFDPGQVRLSEIATLVGRLGYSLTPLSSEPVDRFREQNRRLLMQIAIAGFCAANAMWIAIALYAGDASGVAAEHRSFLRAAAAVLGIATIAFPGRTFFISAWASLRTRTPHMDLPVALGLSIGTAVGIFNAITGIGEVYFDSLAMLVFLLLIGRWIQFRQQHRAATAVDLLLRITPQHARLIDDSEIDSEGGRWVMVDSLSAGQHIRVAAGESIPVDGRVVDGETMLDRSLLTGESVPIPAAVDDEVTAGTINLMRPITVMVKATGAESRIGQVMQSVESAMSQRTPIVQLADRIGGVFVVAVTVLAVLTFGIWFSSGLDVATAHATSLLIVACPCALALATPLAIAVTLGRAAKRRILIRDGHVFERLSRPGIVWFDKTGTLTEGRPRAELIIGDRHVFAIAASVEKAFCHPIADAFGREAERMNLSLPAEVIDAQLCRGGVVGRCEGHFVCIGNEDLMHDHAVRVPESIREAIGECLVRRQTPVMIAVDGNAVAVVAVADPIKRDAAETIRRIQSSGWRVGMLSGDHERVVHQVSSSVGIEPENTFGGLSPEEKLDHVRNNDSGCTVMIGDGANDAAALAAAGVGIAVRGGAEVSLQAAPVFVASGQLSSIAELIDASKQTSRLIRTTFAVSLGYNVIAVGLSLLGYITPLLAAVLMPISSVSVLSTTLLWPTFRQSQSSGS